MRHQIESFKRLRTHQMGVLTVFTAVMVLIILTLMLFYGAQVGVFSQRISANDVRQKMAFNAAEAGIEQGIEYLLANSQLILSNALAAFPDGKGGTRDGWFAANKWVQCTDSYRALPDHPCGGDFPMKTGSYFYDDPDTASGVDSMLPVGAIAGFAEDVTMRLSANMCFVTLDDPDGTNCLGAPGTTAAQSSSYMIITLLGYGFSDCTNLGNVDTCQGRATVAIPIANFKQLAGAPTVPLVSKNTFPPNGTANVVPNPNGGGQGVPISVWINDNPSDADCPRAELNVLSRGTWNTCEMQEWYGLNELPSGVVCPGNNTCGCKTDYDSLSFANDKEPGNTPKIGIDIVPDTDFPCDLFVTFFKTPKAQYEIVKTSAIEIEDCDDLGPTSSGLLWITDPACKLNSETIGSPENPAVLISETSVDLQGQVNIFGVLYIFDGVNSDIDVTGVGRASIYGSLIVDADIDLFSGTFDVVYAEDVLIKAAGLNGFGAVNGGWRDFGLPDLAW